MSPDAARIFHRSDSGDDLWPISGGEKTGRIISGSLGKAEGLIRICRVVFLGVSIPFHDGQEAVSTLHNRRAMSRSVRLCILYCSEQFLRCGEIPNI